jgi:uncharacterized protein YceK
MTQDSFFHPLKLILCFLAVVLLAWLLSGCGSLVRVEYQNPKYGGGAVEFALPKKEGYAK